MWCGLKPARIYVAQPGSDVVNEIAAMGEEQPPLNYERIEKQPVSLWVAYAFLFGLAVIYGIVFWYLNVYGG